MWTVSLINLDLACICYWQFFKNPHTTYYMQKKTFMHDIFPFMVICVLHVHAHVLDGKIQLPVGIYRMPRWRTHWYRVCWARQDRPRPGDLRRWGHRLPPEPRWSHDLVAVTATATAAKFLKLNRHLLSVAYSNISQNGKSKREM